MFLAKETNRQTWYCKQDLAMLMVTKSVFFNITFGHFTAIFAVMSQVF